MRQKLFAASLGFLAYYIYLKLNGDPAKSKWEVTTSLPVVILQLQFFAQNNPSGPLAGHSTIPPADIPGYRNHIYRVYNFANSLLNPTFDRKESELVATMLVYHDIGLWTDKKLGYIEPSVDLFKQHMASIWAEEDLLLGQAVITNHHKLTSFTQDALPQALHGHYNAARITDIVEAVRQADLCDFSYGIVCGHIPPETVAKIKAALPNAGFHATLLNFFPNLAGYQVWKYLDILTIFRL